MTFLRKLFHFDSDASAVEKIATVLVPIAVAALLLWLTIISYGVGHSAVARAHRALPHPASASLWATVLLVGAVFWAWWNWSDRIPFRINDIVATVILIILYILAINANTDFFTQVY